ncbi:hypothetical protein I5907_11895 [Panacibacter sp. DH6]|uniref:Antitoxin Xre-like helix-turn-helix domain-containing protein n=1 Tax=Panacibacter microcysteis TaxID=2793269 RepID=A0A931E4K6_9BACT|nr:antitoxin Xre-like helix-turn-helix domain-containing protein [Panacibacter microcysteis]MBG9376938.1 hypothetical protein [Panacibacter microcysteis]
MAKQKKYADQQVPHSGAGDGALHYRTVKRLPEVADFPYRKFEKIAALVPFTQKDWAGILHLSERTLQRYAKDNSSFEGIYVDRILQMEQLIELGLETFTDATALYSWLRKEKKVLGHTLTFESLYSAQGIQDLIDQLRRIQYGVYS